jgi:hypothetical protein
MWSAPTVSTKNLTSSGQCSRASKKGREEGASKPKWASWITVQTVIASLIEIKAYNNSPHEEASAQAGPATGQCQRGGAAPRPGASVEGHRHTDWLSSSDALTIELAVTIPGPPAARLRFATKAVKWLAEVRRQAPTLFAHRRIQAQLSAG